MTTVNSLNKNPPSAVLAVAKSLISIYYWSSKAHTVTARQSECKCKKQETVRILYPVREDEAR